MRLGKLAPRFDERTLKLARYVNLSQLPAAPEATDRAATKHSAFQMFDNDKYGDCTCAGMGNYELFWSSLTSRAVELTTEDILSAYSAITGFNPVTGANDNGAVELDVLNYWRTVGLAGHKIGAYAAINLTNQELARTSMYLFDGVYLGVALPVTAQSQEVWDYEPQFGSQAYPGSWGGHCIVAVDYNSVGPLVATWGSVKQMTWAFWDHYVDEAYVVIAPEQLDDQGKTAEGFDLAALQADLQAVSG